MSTSVVIAPSRLADLEVVIERGLAAFVSAQAWGLWAGSLFVASLEESDLRRFTLDGGAAVQRDVLLDRRYGRLRSPVLGPNGALYVTTSNGAGDRIVRLTASQ